MFGVLIPVGPGDRELARLAAVVGELARFERPEELALWVVDDAPAARDITVDWPRVSVLRTALRERGRVPDIYSAHVAGTLQGLAAIRDAGMEFALKLDTDIAVIGGFSDRIRAAFAADPGLGVVGSYDRTSDGEGRDWSMWPAVIDRADRPFAVRRGIDGRYRVTRRGPQMRRFIADQRAAAYAFAPAGAHCLGGAYAVSGAFLSTAALDWQPWIASTLGEDVTVGLLSSAAGLRMRSLTAVGEPFALAWQGLPDTPEALADGGYGIVHSVKAGSPAEEAQLRERLQGAASTG